MAERKESQGHLAMNCLVLPGTVLGWDPVVCLTEAFPLVRGASR